MNRFYLYIGRGGAAELFYTALAVIYNNINQFIFYFAADNISQFSCSALAVSALFGKICANAVILSLIHI